MDAMAGLWGDLCCGERERFKGPPLKTGQQCKKTRWGVDGRHCGIVGRPLLWCEKNVLRAEPPLKTGQQCKKTMGV